MSFKEYHCEIYPCNRGQDHPSANCNCYCPGCDPEWSECNECFDGLHEKCSEKECECKHEKKERNIAHARGRSEAVKEIREMIEKELEDWTTWTCHSRKEHESLDNDCPGWSHEDQQTRATVIGQVKYKIIEILKALT